MAHAALRAGLRDVAFTTPTPFDEDGAVDHDALAANLAATYDAGGRCFLACGNTGEYYALTDAERTAVVETHVDALAAHADTDNGATILGGVGGSTREAVALAEAYAEAGADGLLAMHPSFTYVHADGLLEHYRRIATATDLGLVVYKRGPTVPRRVLTELAGHESVVGVKFAVEDAAEFARTVAEADVDPALAPVWLNGVAERYACAFHAEGADAYTTGIGNALPAATLALWDSLEASDWERARALRDLLRPLEEIRQEPGPNNDVPAANNVPVVKHAMDYVGLTGGPCRTPLVGLSESDRKWVEDAVDAVRDADLTSV
ncbi:MAG: dihydrodipicolinate synthase family protein [Halobacteriaceae archaeon]